MGSAGVDLPAKVPIAPRKGARSCAGTPGSPGAFGPSSGASVARRRLDAGNPVRVGQIRLTQIHSSLRAIVFE